MENGGLQVSKHLDDEARSMRHLLASGLAEAQRLIYEEAQHQLPEEGQDGTKERIGNYLYFVRSLPQQPHRHYLRQPVMGGPEQTVLDLNQMTRQSRSSVEIGQLKLSPSHRQIAFTASYGGPFLAIVKDLASGSEGPIVGLEGVLGLEWVNEGCFLYTTSESGVRPDKVWKHVIGSGQQDELLLEENMQECHLSLTKTKDGAFVVISSNSKISSEVHILDTREAEGRPRLVHARQKGLEYFVEHVGGRLIILTNADGAMDNCLASAPVQSPQKSNWRVVLPARSGVAIEDLDVFRSYAVLWERHQGQPGFSTLEWDACGLDFPDKDLEIAEERREMQARPDAHRGNRQQGGELVEEVGQPPTGMEVRGLRSFRFSDAVTKLSLGANADFLAASVDVVISSPVLPEQPVSLDLEPAAQSMQARDQMNQRRSSSAAARRGVARVWRDSVGSLDGTQVPLTVVRGEHVHHEDAQQPCLFRIYGAYGMSLEAGFNPVDSLLLRRGWTLAFAHVRGGGELGRRWHHAGRQFGKLLALQDGDACLDHLLTQGLATRGHVGLQGVSAGGVLAANLLMKRPSDFGGAVLRMPFLDLFTAMTDPEQALTQHEWDEWGHPEQPGGLQHLWNLCPYQGIERLPSGATLPPILVTAGAVDERVPVWMPAKWVTALRAKLGPGAEVHLNVNPGGHHLDADEEFRLDALEAAFLTRAFLTGGTRQ